MPDQECSADGDSAAATQFWDANANGRYDGRKCQITHIRSGVTPAMEGIYYVIFFVKARQSRYVI